MTSYLFKDTNKAAFINGLNSLFDEYDKPKVETRHLLNYPPGKLDYTLYNTNDDREVEIIDQAISDNHFDFSVKKIDLKDMVNESRKYGAPSKPKRGRKKKINI